MKTKIHKFISSQMNCMSKKQIILGSFLALAGIANAQWTNACPPILMGCNAGIGTNAPADKLHISSSLPGSVAGGGALIEHTGGYAALIRFKTDSSYFGLYGSGSNNGLSGNNLAIYDYNAGAHRFVLRGNGNIGIGTNSPSEQLHTTGGVMFSGLTTGGTGLSSLSIDGSGKLWIGGGGGITNACTTTDNIPKCTSAGNLVCSQISDDGTTVGINSPANCSFNWGGIGGWLTGSTVPPGSGTARLCVNGVTKALGFFATSDERFKKNIRPIDNALNIITRLSGKTYFWRNDEFKDRDFTSAMQIGFIAQELEKVIPEVVVTGGDGYKSVNYDMIIPILTQGIKEQQTQIENQAKEIADLKNQMNAQNKFNASTGIKQLNSAADGFALDQNIPNPFSQETVINYTLPQQIKNASLIVYDLSGKQLTSFPLELNGKSITITSEKLAAGIYIYSVMADGKIMDSKRMVVADKQ